jgi:hypothetical protein
LRLISKLRNNSAGYLKWYGTSVQSGKDKRPIYGDKVDYCNLPLVHFKYNETKKQICTCIYQFNVIHKKFAAPLNVVTIIKKIKTGY